MVERSKVRSAKSNAAESAESAVSAVSAESKARQIPAASTGTAVGPTTDPSTAGAGGCLLRVAWLIGAPVALLTLAALIVRDSAGPLDIYSALYGGTVLAALGLRYVDIVRFNGLTTSGEPATLADYRRYVLRFCAFALALWLAVTMLF